MHVLHHPEAVLGEGGACLAVKGHDEEVDLTAVRLAALVAATQLPAVRIGHAARPVDGPQPAGQCFAK